MKKTPKKVLGFLGLAFVVAMTIFAAALPNPEALAASSSMTDTIIVRVIAGTPDVNIIKPSSGSVFVGPEHVVSFDFSKSDDVLVTLEKEMPSGSPQIYTLYEGHPNQTPGTDSVTIDLSGPFYGYGEYTIHIRGTTGGGLLDEDSVKFSYVPVSATVEEDDTGEVNAFLHYDDDNDDLSHFEINVYDDQGNLVEELSPITVDRPVKEVNLPFAEQKVPAGKYTVVVTAYDVTGEEIHRDYDYVFVYDPVRVPDTGGLLKGLNIARSDYLITGLIIFFTVGLAGIVFVAKGKKSSRK